MLITPRLREALGGHKNSSVLTSGRRTEKFGRQALGAGMANSQTVASLNADVAAYFQFVPSDSTLATGEFE